MKTIKQIIKEEIDNSLDWLNDIEPSQWDIMEFIRTEKPEVWKFGKHWDGDLNLRGTSIKDLGELESVGGSLYLWNTQIKDLGNLKSVGGGLYLQDTPITNLGNLKSVGGGLDLRYTPITNLGNLESVGGYLDLQNTPLSKKYSEREIRSMVSVGWDVNL